jgi:Tol biopolymer transport system component
MHALTRRKPQALPCRIRAGLTLLAAMLLMGVGVYAAHAAGSTVCASVAPGGVPAGGATLYPQALSNDGRLVVFESNSPLLVPEDDLADFEVFVHDSLAGTTQLVSLGVDGSYKGGLNPSISGNGRYVAFEKGWEPFVLGVFVRDLQTSQTIPIGPMGPGAGGGQCPSMPDDGQLVTFDSFNALVPGDTNGMEDVFVRALSGGDYERVSIPPAGGQFDTPCFNSKMSADGRFVVFDNFASFAGTGANDQLYVRDRQNGSTALASVALDGGLGNAHSGQGTLSDNGRFVAFTSSASNLVPDDTNQSADVFVRDMQNGVTTRVNVSSSGITGPSTLGAADISGDGRFVTFTSESDQLIDGDSNARPDVFVHDRLTGGTQRASLSGSDQQADDYSSAAAISGDGRTVAFLSRATNLVAGDANGSTDVFLRDITTNDFVRPTGTAPSALPVSLPFSGGTVTLGIDAGDNVAVAGVKATVSSEAQGFFQIADLSIASGGAANGHWSGSVQIPANPVTDARTYRARFVVTDGSGNQTPPLEATFSVQGAPPPDDKVPALSSAQASPAEVPASGGTVHLSITATDNRGVTGVQALVGLPSGPGDPLNLQRASGTDTDGSWEGDFQIPANDSTTPQAYSFQFLARDAAGNQALTQNPVLVTVGPGGGDPEFSIDPLRLNFPATPIAHSALLELHITNTGGGTLTGKIGKLKAPFKVLAGGGSYSVGPGQTINVFIEFKPSTKKAASTSLKITSSDPAHPSTNIPMKGKGSKG